MKAHLKLFVLLATFFCQMEQPNLLAKPAILPLTSLLEQQPEIQKQTLHAATRLHFTPFPIASSEDSTYATPRIPETFILKIPNGSVYSAQGIVFTKNTLIEELIWPWSPLKWSLDELSSIPLSKRINGTIAVLAQEGYRNYYHWLLEILPKIALLEESAADYDWLYLPQMDLPFQRETLNLLGIDTSKIIETTPDTHIEVSMLIAPSFASRSCYTPNWIAQYLRERLMANIQKDPESPKKLFISRSLASQRRIINECEIEHYLGAKGFTTVHLETLSVQEQHSFFHNATMIVALHGAGLANILFSEPGTKVVEIFQALEDDTYCYLSQTLDLDYHAIATTEFSPNGRTLDTVVDWEQLKIQLETLVND